MLVFKKRNIYYVQQHGCAIHTLYVIAQCLLVNLIVPICALLTTGEQDVTKWEMRSQISHKVDFSSWIWSLNTPSCCAKLQLFCVKTTPTYTICILLKALQPPTGKHVLLHACSHICTYICTHTHSCKHAHTLIDTHTVKKSAYTHMPL